MASSDGPSEFGRDSSAFQQKNGPHSFDRVCEGCALGKSHRLPFPTVSETEYELMGLLVVHLTGPMSVETWSGKSYAIVVLKVSRRYGVGDLLESKDEAYAALVKIVARLERQSGKKCKIIRTDNGTEFVNLMVERFCERNGIVHQTTVPYTPEQNGIAERAIAVYFDMVRCMLHSGKMDLRYWGEAFMYSIHVRNLWPTSGLKDKVPLEGWTNRKASVGHLRVFGSIGYVTIPKKVRGGKLEPTSVKCRLLGWMEDETKGYRLEDVETKKLFFSRDVRFIEDETPTELAVIDSPSSPGMKLNDLGGTDAPERPPENENLITQRPQEPTTTEQAPAAPEKHRPPSKWAILPPRDLSSKTRALWRCRNRG
jgi:transposase InsO family protein